MLAFLIIVGIESIVRPYRLPSYRSPHCRKCTHYFDAGSFHELDDSGCRVVSFAEVDSHKNIGGFVRGYSHGHHACVTKRENQFSIPYACYKSNTSYLPCLL